MRINALIQLKQPRLRHWNIKQNCLLIIRGTEDFIKRLVCFVALIEELPAHLMLSGQMANRFGFRQNFNQAFRKQELDWQRLTWVDSFLQSRLEDTTNNEYLRSMPLTSNLRSLFPKAVLKVLPAFEPCHYSSW